MDLLIILTYVAFAWAIFKIFRIPVNQWTLATAALGGVFLVSGLILLMNYNHPYTFTAQKAVIAIPITPQVTGIVTEVTDKNNQLIQKGEVLFKLDPVRYQARVDRLQADLMTATHNIKTLRAQLTEAQANTTQVSAERDRLFKNYQRYLKGSQAAVNPFSERDIDDARQNFLAQDALVDDDPRRGLCMQAGLDHQLIVETRGRQIVRLDPADRKDQPLLLQDALIDAQFAQPFGTPALDEFQIVGVIDDTGKIGIFIINADRKAVHDTPDTSVAGGFPPPSPDGDSPGGYFGMKEV